MDLALAALPERTIQLIAWVSHHLPLEDGTLVGGAEMTDQKLLSIAPEEVEVFSPQNWQEAMECERVIITGTDLLSDEAMAELATKNPVVAVHHKQTRSQARAELIDSASMFICRSPRHLEIELEWASPKASSWVSAPLDSSELQPAKKKEEFALWAARLHQQKGPNEAMEWAQQNKVPLLMMHNKERSVVLEAMSRARYFVFLPNDFDAEPRAVIEAVLSGCEIITNDNAGVSSIPDWRNPDTLRSLVESAGERFWQLALQ